MIEPINGSGSVFYPSITKNGTLYYTRNDGGGEFVYRSKFIEGKFSEPEKLPPNVNSSSTQYNTFTSPDEDYIIIPFLKENSNGENYMVSFRDNNDNWSELIDLGPTINNGEGGWTPSLSHDGKYFFFQRHLPKHRNLELDYSKEKHVNFSDIVRIHNEPGNGNGDIYWVDAKVITKLNPFKN